MTQQIMITLNQIKAHNPCEDGWANVLAANGGGNADYDKPFPVSSILDSNSLSDTVWVFRCLPEHTKLIQYFAWWCAKQVECHADDGRVKACLDITKKYLDGEATRKELKAAAEAARAARAAAWAAAEVAVWEAAWAAARAARAAAWAAVEVAVWEAWEAWTAAAREAQTAKLREILDIGEFKE